MEAIHLFSLASQKSNWLSVRQSAIAENISHVNTPGHKARDVQPFSEVMDKTRLMMAATNAAHLELDGQPRSHNVKKSDSWTVTHSGNSVSVEQELIKAGEVSRDHSMTTALVKSFHRMLLMSVKG